MLTVNLSNAQFSAIQCSGVVECPETVAEFIIGQSLSIGKLSIGADQVEEVWGALNDLSNAEDETHQDTSRDSDERKYAGRAARSLATLAGKVIRLRVN